MFVKKNHEISKYPLKEIANTNGAIVYATRLDSYGRVVIMKKFKEENYVGLMEFIVREINYLSNVHHSNIVSLLEIWPDGPLPTLIMDHGGTDLWQYGNQISRYQRAILMVPVFGQAFNGLNFMHTNRLIHRDLKSSNILIRIDDRVTPPVPIVKICDFGLVRSIYHEMTPNSGTPNYKAPEVFECEVEYTEKVDMWAMGCIVYEWLEHRVLFSGSSDSTIAKKLESWMTKKLVTIAKLSENTDSLYSKNIWYVQSLMNELLIVDPNDRATCERCIQLLGAELLPVTKIHRPIMVRKSMLVDLNVRHVVVANILELEKYHDVDRKVLALGIDLFDRWLMIDGGNDDMVLYSIASVILASYKYKVLLPENFAAKYSEEIIVEAIQTLFRMLDYNIEYLDLWSLMAKIVREHNLPRSDEHIEHYWKRVCDLLLNYTPLFAKAEEDLIGLLDQVVD